MLHLYGREDGAASVAEPRSPPSGIGFPSSPSVSRPYASVRDTRDVHFDDASKGSLTYDAPQSTENQYALTVIPHSSDGQRYEQSQYQDSSRRPHSIPFLPPGVSGKGPTGLHLIHQFSLAAQLEEARIKKDECNRGPSTHAPHEDAHFSSEPSVMVVHEGIIFLGNEDGICALPVILDELYATTVQSDVGKGTRVQVHSENPALRHVVGITPLSTPASTGSSGRHTSVRVVTREGCIWCVTYLQNGQGEGRACLRCTQRYAVTPTPGKRVGVVSCVRLQNYASHSTEYDLLSDWEGCLWLLHDDEGPRGVCGTSTKGTQTLLPGLPIQLSATRGALPASCVLGFMGPTVLVFDLRRARVQSSSSEPWQLALYTPRDQATSSFDRIAGFAPSMVRPHIQAVATHPSAGEPTVVATLSNRTIIQWDMRFLSSPVRWIPCRTEASSSGEMPMLMTHLVPAPWTGGSRSHRAGSTFWAVGYDSCIYEYDTVADPSCALQRIYPWIPDGHLEPLYSSPQTGIIKTPPYRTPTAVFAVHEPPVTGYNVENQVYASYPHLIQVTRHTSDLSIYLMKPSE